MKTFKIRSNSNSFSGYEGLLLHDYCVTIIFETEIICQTNILRVKYTRQNGFKLFDLMNFAIKQYLVECNYYDEENEENNNIVYNESDIDWNNDHLAWFEHTLVGFEYDECAKIVKCLMDH